MKGEPTAFWAKIDWDESGHVTSWHPLKAHSADVAAVAEALLEKTILGRRFARLLGAERPGTAMPARLCMLTALHDVGKVNHGFQERARGGRTAGHVSPLVDFLAWDEEEKTQIVEALGLRRMVGWFGSESELCEFLLATFCHHGRPVRPSAGFQPRLWRPRGERNPIAGMRAVRQAAERWFPEAFGEKGPPFPTSPAFQHAFNGLLTLADWIGSDEEMFPYAEGEGDRMPAARGYADAALARLGLDAEGARAGLGPDRPGFEAVCCFEPRPLQRTCTELPDRAEGSLTILEAETGSGKTEAALARFAQLFHAGLVDGMYFALPTRTAATQLHGRVLKAVRRAFPDPDHRPPVVLAVPDYLGRGPVVDEMEGRRLAPFEVLWPDDERDRWRYRGWAAERPKRYLAGSVAVGTIDQVLLSALQVKHAHLRATSLMRHLLVVDEVHASDAYMWRLLEEVLDYHLSAGGHAFLMSATLGTVAQARLLNDAPQEPPPFGEARELSYPLVSHTGTDRGPTERVETEPVGYEKAVEMEARPIAGRPEEVARTGLDAARTGARVLVIRNTVRDCIATQRALEALAGADSPVLFGAGGVPAPHHSRFATPDRERLDRAIEQAFGKQSTRDGVVAVATQTVQQSLDLDADLLLSDLCPVDVLLQRIGRLHRHPKERPPAERAEGFRTARTIVLVPEERSLETHIASNGCAYGPHGIGPVYEDLRMLEATWRLIEGHPTWRIPSINRLLVESATHPEPLAQIVRSLGGRWPEHQSQVLGLRSADRSHAGLVLLPRDRPFGEVAFPDDLDERIKTRLGEGDRRVVLQSAVRSPFGARMTELRLPAWYAPDADEDDEVENLDAAEGPVTFDFAGRSFVYNRLGLHPAGADYMEEDADE
ncbi:MAG: CRISPR-associated helicase Cas3' [Planctomycetota bacterium]